MGTYERKDALYLQAKKEGYLSRAAYKLIELDQKHRFLRRGIRVLDLGSFPGGWLQVALDKVGPEGLVVGIDIREIDSFTVPWKQQGEAIDLKAHILQGDIRDEESWAAIFAISSQKFNLVMSDMSPKISGVKFRDQAESAELVEMAFVSAERALVQGGTLIAKIFPGPEADQLFKKYQRQFKKLKRIKLKSTRKTSTELYLLGEDFQGSTST